MKVGEVYSTKYVSYRRQKNSNVVCVIIPIEELKYDEGFKIVVIDDETSVINIFIDMEGEWSDDYGSYEYITELDIIDYHDLISRLFGNEYYELE